MDCLSINYDSDAGVCFDDGSCIPHVCPTNSSTISQNLNFSGGNNSGDAILNIYINDSQSQQDWVMSAGSEVLFTPNDTSITPYQLSDFNTLGQGFTNGYALTLYRCNAGSNIDILNSQNGTITFTANFHWGTDACDNDDCTATFDRNVIFGCMNGLSPNYNPNANIHVCDAC